jgi:hypothetical protein
MKSAEVPSTHFNNQSAIYSALNRTLKRLPPSKQSLCCQIWSKLLEGMAKLIDHPTIQ